MKPGVDEFRQRFSGRYFGKYRGIVKDVQDDRKLGRIKLIAPVVAGEELLGWAWPAPAQGGGTNDGSPYPPGVGDYVWVEFEEGDPGRPIWSAGPWGMREGSNSVPKNAQGEFDDEDRLIRNLGKVPPSSFKGEYGDVRVIARSKTGHSLVFDDTAGEERVQLFHRTGSRLEMLSDGGIQMISAADFRRRVTGSIYEEIGGNLVQEVAGSLDIKVKGQGVSVYEQDQSYRYRNVAIEGLARDETWNGNSLTSINGSYDLLVGSQLGIQTGGQLSFMVGQSMQQTILETFEMAISNSVGLPIDRAALIQVYNGHFELLATDITGAIPTQAVNLILDPTLGKAVLGAGSSAGGGLVEILNTPLANIHLGGVGVTEPFVLGIQLVALLTTVLTDLATHVHPTAAPGAPSPPVTAAVYASAVSQLSGILSLKILGG